MIESLTPLLFSLFFNSQYDFNATAYDKIAQSLHEIQRKNPEHSEVFTLGLSDQGLPIYGLKIGQKGKSNLIVGTHHGNEFGSTAVAIAAAEQFAQNPIQDQTLYVVPVLNVSGYNTRSRNERGPNNRSVDSNRDYDGPCRSGRAFQLSSTQSLSRLVNEKNIVASATLHTYMPGVLYPWGFSTRETMTADQSQYVDLARLAAKESGYKVGNSTEELYAADGTFEDYAYWKYGIWSLLFEMGSSHNPTQREIENMIRVNIPGLRRFFEETPPSRSVQNQFTGRCDKSVRQRSKMD